MAGSVPRNRNFIARWARQVRGLTVAEHAILMVLAYFAGDRGKCRVSIGHLVWRFEKKRVYVRQVIYSLVKKGFISVEQRFDKKGLQETNVFTLHSDRWFPADAGHEVGMRLLRSVIRDITIDPNMKSGFAEAWVQDLPKRHSKVARPTLFITVDSDDHYNLLTLETPALIRKLEKTPPFLRFNIVAVRTYDDKYTEE